MNILYFSLLAILAAAPTSDSELVPIIHQGETQSQVLQSGNDALNQSIVSGDAAVKESIDSKLNTLTQAVNELKVQGAAHTAAVKKAHAVADKRARLEWALQNFPIVPAFTYYEGRHQKQSSFLLPLVLFSFRQDRGFYVDYSLNYEGRGGKGPSEAGAKEFQDALEDRLHKLIGIKPRFSKNAEGKWSVWYD
jgi:hypothetical protein